MGFLIKLVTTILFCILAVQISTPVDPNANGGGYWNPACNRFVAVGCVHLGDIGAAVVNPDSISQVYP